MLYAILGLEGSKYYSEHTSCTIHEIGVDELIVIVNQLNHLTNEPELPLIGPKEVRLSRLFRVHVNSVIYRLIN